MNAIIKEKFCASSDPNTCSLLTVGSTSEEISEVVLDGANQWFLDHENDMLIISLLTVILTMLIQICQMFMISKC